VTQQRRDEIQAELQQSIAGEVRFDRYSRALYSTDASIYQIEPLGVVIPRDRSDVVATIEVAARYGVPVLPRGGGTSLGGQAVGPGIHLDFSKMMNRILEVNSDERRVRVEAGVILDHLNAHLKPHGLMFGPDPASANRATLAGVIGNNAAGSHSILYGRSVDHTLTVRAVLADGHETTFAATDPARVGQLGQGDGLEARIHREVARIVREHEAEIREDWPRHWRRASGYNLDEFVAGRPFNIAKLLAGSEGTLAVMTELTLNLVPRPPRTALDVIHFDSLTAAMDAVNIILECQPSAVELLDEMLLNLTRQVPLYARQLTFVEGQPGALLAVEFYGESEADLAARLNGLEAHLKRQGIRGPFVRALTPAAQANVWSVRKAGLGLLMSMKGDWKPIPFVEDTSVPPQALPAYIRDFERILAEYQTRAAFYAHASAGCLHIRPLINLKRADEIAKMRDIATAISDLVAGYGGVMSGEHGDGLARSLWLEKTFGPRLYQAFREVKAAFDPHGIMNPGKIVEAPDMTANLRYGPGYRTIDVPTHLDFSRDGGFAGAVEMCNGSGVCRKLTTGTMCPSYMVTLEEEHSTRGRANALRAALSGLLPPEELTSPRMHQVLDLCIACKACKAECPSQVDMARLKYEFLAKYHAVHGLPLRSRLFGQIAALSRLGSATAPFSNWVLRNPVVRLGLERFVGIDRRRSLPAFARPTFSTWFKRHRPGRRQTNGRVALFHDTFLEYNEPRIGIAATQVLEAAGYEVVLTDHRCCGRPMISQGMLAEARRNAEYNVAQLAPLAEQGIPIIGFEPSCVSALREEYPDFVRHSSATLVAQQTLLFDEFLDTEQVAGKLTLHPHAAPRDVLLHGHCHQKALIGTTPTLAVLRAVPGLNVTEIDAGCCGMAGAFGYEVEHYRISQAMGERALFKAIRAAHPEAIIIADGVSCRQQIKHGTGRRALHLAEVLSDALEGPGPGR